MNTKQAFEAFHEELKLDKDELQEAIDTHHNIRDTLSDSGVTVGAILQGSLARATMLSPLHDIDMVVFLAAKHRHLLDDWDGPSQAMDMIEAVLRSSYSDATFERSQYAIKIRFVDRDFAFDVVLAFDRDDSDLIDIANVDTNTWDESDTRLVIAAVQDRNIDLEGVFVHQVRMAKNWGRQACPDIPGFAIECVTYAVLDERLPANEALAVVYPDGVAAVKSGHLLVPGSDDNILDRLTKAEIETLSATLDDAATRAAEANALTDDGDHEAAIDIWHDLLGDPFPESDHQSAAEALAGMLSGGVTSAGRTTQSKTAATRGKPTRAWRPA